MSEHPITVSAVAPRPGYPAYVRCDRCGTAWAGPLPNEVAEALAARMNAHRRVDDPALLRGSLCCEIVPDEVAASEATASFAWSTLRSTMTAGRSVGRVGFLGAAVLVRLVPRIARSASGGTMATGVVVISLAAALTSAVAPGLSTVLWWIAYGALAVGLIATIATVAWLWATEPVEDAADVGGQLIVRRFDDEPGEVVAFDDTDLIDVATEKEAGR